MKKTVLLLSLLFLFGCVTYYPEDLLIEQVSPGSVKPSAYGPTVEIRSIENLDPGPITHILAKELLRGGYSVQNNSAYSGYSSYSGYRGRGQWSSYFPTRMSEGGSWDRNQSCSRVDYFLDVGARPVRGSSGGVSGRRSAWGYGASSRGYSSRREVEVYLTFYDGRTGRAVPGKSAVARIRVGSSSSVLGDLVTRVIGMEVFVENYNYDPVTEAAVRVIPRLIQTEGRR